MIGDMTIWSIVMATDKMNIKQEYYNLLIISFSFLFFTRMTMNINGIIMMLIGKKVEVTDPMIGSWDKWFFISKILFNLMAFLFS
jgi:hypothetical protein